MGDLISRQAVIEALREYLIGKRCPDDGTLTCRLIENEVINKLPPAQPKTNYSESPNTSDCISRQQAIDALRKMQTYKMFSGDDMLLIDQAGAQTELMLLPPIQPEIVRCKDCKHRDPEDKKCDCGHDILWQLPRRDDWYCADAERREVTK